MNATRTEETAGTWLQGHIVTTRANLEAVFGEPIRYEDGGKVTIEWGLKFEDGTIATVYDWKRYEMGTPALDEEITYNIGGILPEAVTRVQEALKASKAKIERSLFIECREWFDKVNGNSYFSARIWVDGGQVAILPFQYGYGDQFIYEAQKKLLELGYLPQNGKNRGLWSIAEAQGFDYYTAKTNTKKAEMFKMYENYQERAVA
jgi:hypothetical protein